jgi:hypothetical protein
MRTISAFFGLLQDWKVVERDVHYEILVNTFLALIFPCPQTALLDKSSVTRL